ncbi:hypothetical protein JRQ81_017492 [Phrynocephalus forsythii]|uniref:G domain-containing protein n=1 Tax=Phrynocephalus forsythii TaxID=171643 RepID=A0A9Q0XSE8_9SAUR|nr:hypothetical protein JRQ81_017492 [Phrynocephalus forsythii]
MDLADLTHKERILQHLEQQGHRKILFTECLKDENVKQMVPILTELISNSLRYQRSENPESSIMVIGIPNVGKSSVINSIRRMHLKKGILHCLSYGFLQNICQISVFQVCDRPLMYLLDTPGVLTPRIENVETGLKLALCGAIHDHMVGAEVIADYLLYMLNRQQQFRYVELYGLDGPSDDIESVLKRIAQHLGKTSRVRVLTGTDLSRPAATAAAAPAAAPPAAAAATLSDVPEEP